MLRLTDRGSEQEHHSMIHTVVCSRAIDVFFSLPLFGPVSRQASSVTLLVSHELYVSGEIELYSYTHFNGQSAGARVEVDPLHDHLRRPENIERGETGF